MISHTEPQYQVLRDICDRIVIESRIENFGESTIHIRINTDRLLKSIEENIDTFAEAYRNYTGVSLYESLIIQRDLNEMDIVVHLEDYKLEAERIFEHRTNRVYTGLKKKRK